VTAPAMPRLGATFPVATTLGWAPASDHTAVSAPPADGSVASLRSDLALLASLGVTDVRLPVDWARLEPRPGAWDGTAVEWLDEALTAAAAAGVRVWAALLEGPLPAWLADEGGLGDDRAMGRWWPRFCDRVAEHLGDRLGGWVPVVDPVGIATAAYETGARPPHRTDERMHAEVVRRLAVAWRDAWRVLRGGPPVATCLGLATVQAADDTVPAWQAARRRDRLVWEVWTRALRDGVVAVPGLPEVTVPDLAGACDVLGGIAVVPDGIEPARWEDDLGTLVRRLAESGPDRPGSITVSLVEPDDRRRTELAGASVTALRGAVADGVRLEVAFASPALGALVSRDRDETGATAAWRSLTG